MPDGLTAARWDAEYRRGRYAGEPPLPWVATIVETIRRDAHARGGVGLYVGCGNGRNYVPLVEAGLDLHGLDLSAEALGQLAARCPALAPRLWQGDVREFVPPAPLAYLIALQVFQHGDAGDAARYFARVAALLRPGGLFFLRVNAASTQVERRHAVTERAANGSFSVRYLEGPKEGLSVHFYSEAELHTLAAGAFDTVMAPREERIQRTAPETGFWAQWEVVFRRR